MYFGLKHSCLSVSELGVGSPLGDGGVLGGLGAGRRAALICCARRLVLRPRILGAADRAVLG